MMTDSAKAQTKVQWIFVMMVTSSFGMVEHRSFSQISLTSETGRGLKIFTIGGLIPFESDETKRSTELENERFSE